MSDSIHIVLLGKSGSGKSTTGNTVVRHKIFRSNCMSESASQSCETANGILLDQRVRITDTPDICKFLNEPREIARFINMTLPGPHILLFMLPVDHLTQEDVESLIPFKHLFGGDVEEHLVVVFTHANDLKKRNTTESQYLQSVQNSSPMLARIKGRYVFLENDPKYPTKEQVKQLKQLLAIIRDVMLKNGGKCYSNDMYKKKLKER